MLVAVGLLIVAAFIIAIVGTLYEKIKVDPLLKLTGKERQSYRTTMLVKDNIKLCAACHKEYKIDEDESPFCTICNPMEGRKQTTVEGWEERARGRKSNRGYQPLYISEGFSDLYEEAGK